MVKIYVDLIVEEYGLSNPVLIAEKIEEEFNVEVSIMEVENYLEPSEDLEKSERLHHFKLNSNYNEYSFI